jgi:hypothetical protein
MQAFDLGCLLRHSIAIKAIGDVGLKQNVWASGGLISVKPIVEGFTQCKDLCWFLIFKLFSLDTEQKMKKKSSWK